MVSYAQASEDSAAAPLNCSTIKIRDLNLKDWNYTMETKGEDTLVFVAKPKSKNSDLEPYELRCKVSHHEKEMRVTEKI